MAKSAILLAVYLPVKSSNIKVYFEYLDKCCNGFRWNTTFLNYKLSQVVQENNLVQWLKLFVWEADALGIFYLFMVHQIASEDLQYQTSL